jgi:hypothetical protein
MVQAAQQQRIISAALAYAALGLSIIPLDGKRPALTSWTAYQQTSALAETIRAWNSAGLLKSLAMTTNFVCIIGCRFCQFDTDKSGDEL